MTKATDRKPNVVRAGTGDESINTEAVAAMFELARSPEAHDLAQDDQLELLELAGDMGALRALELTRSLVAAATVRIFQKVCESKRIKDLPIRRQDGSVAVATGIDDFCRLAFGKPRSAMFEASASLEALGDDAYEAANRLGLNRSALRAARALPPEKLEIVRAAISAGSAKADVLSVIEDLAEKVQQAETTLTEARAEKDATDQLLDKKNKKIDQLERAVKRIATLPPDEALVATKTEATTILSEALGMVRGRLRQALVALNDAADHPSKTLFMAGLVAQVQAELAALRDEFSLPDTVGDGTPEWERWAQANPVPGTTSNPR